jgi:hypothetical protein
LFDKKVNPIGAKLFLDKGMFCFKLVVDVVKSESNFIEGDIMNGTDDSEDVRFD